MALTFKPKSEEELQRFKNLPEGEYPFTVIESMETLSKSAKNAGRSMIKLKLNVHGPDYDRHVYDYFADWFSEYKLKHFCEGTGLAANYSAGMVDARDNNFRGRTGLVRLTIEDDPQYGTKNVVEDYIVKVPVNPNPVGSQTKLAANYSVGLVDARDNNFRGRTGLERLTIEDDPQYGTKNVVGDYIVKVPVNPNPVGSQTKLPEDDVPF